MRRASYEEGILRVNPSDIVNPNNTPQAQHLTMNCVAALMTSHTIMNPNNTPQAQQSQPFKKRAPCGPHVWMVAATIASRTTSSG
jgi:hypothetical protein